MLFDIPGMGQIKFNPMQAQKVQKALNALQVGQILKAAVVSDAKDNRLMLNINGQNINAKTKQPFNKGELLEVKVSKNADEIILKVINKEKLPISIVQAQKQILPMQKPPVQLLNTLQQLQQLPHNSPEIPKPIMNQLKQLITSIIPKEKLQNPQLLKQVIKDNGVFLENKLMQTNSQPLTSDFKNQLSQLLKTIELLFPKASAKQGPTVSLPQAPALSTNHSTIASPQSNAVQHYYQQSQSNSVRHESIPLKDTFPQPLPKPKLVPLNLENPQTLINELKQQLHSSLARVQANQLASVTNENHVTLVMDLPVINKQSIDVIPLKIEEQDSNNSLDGKQKVWSVSFALALERLGDMQIKVSLVGDKVNLNFWLDKQQTLEVIDAEKSFLGSEFEALQLHLNQLQTQLGLLDNGMQNSSFNLLDLRI